MLTGRSEIMLQVVLGTIVLTILYLGVERLWVSKTNAQLQAARFSQAYSQCVAKLEAKDVKEPKVK